MHKKYPEIENTYRQKEIDRFLELYSELEKETYIIQEKLDGSNVQVIFHNGEMSFGSRNQIIDKEFQGVDLHKFINEKYPYIVDKFIEMSYNQTIHLYGELFGKGIQNRVNYGNDKYLKFFDIVINDILQPPRTLIDLLDGDYIVPILGYSNSLKSALEYDCYILTQINPIAGNIAEGIVIKPYNQVYVSKVGKIFILKKKNEKFAEKTKSKNKVKNTDPELESWQNTFNEYINENRFKSIYSKEGVIEEPNQIGNYMKWIIEDAKEDFFKDYPKAFTFDKKYIKSICSAANKIVLNELKKEL